LLLITCLLSLGQIKGRVMDNDSIPVERAKIMNITTHTQSISNINGEFEIEGTIGDSVQINHVSYNFLKFKVEEYNDTYLLSPKNYSLQEVVVSSDEAFKLFKKSCENTFNRLEDKCISRGFLQYLKTEDNDTLIIQYLDLDIERQKSKSFDEGEKISIYKIQEKTVYNSIPKEKDFKLSKYICPPINQFDWDIFSRSYNYFKDENSQYFKLYFISKKSQTDNVVHFEVIIQKEDTCLLLIAKTLKGVFLSGKGEKSDIRNLYSYTKYNIGGRFSFLSETYDKVIFTHPKNERKNIEMSIYYKTHNNMTYDSKLRSKNYKIYKNVFHPDIVKNRYYKDFWLNNPLLEKMNYDFEYLSNFKIE